MSVCMCVFNVHLLCLCAYVFVNVFCECVSVCASVGLLPPVSQEIREGDVITLINSHTAT